MWNESGEGNLGSFLGVFRKVSLEARKGNAGTECHFLDWRVYVGPEMGSRFGAVVGGPYPWNVRSTSDA